MVRKPSLSSCELIAALYLIFVVCYPGSAPGKGGGGEEEVDISPEINPDFKMVPIYMF